jgi:hypothetical protein
LYSGGSHEAGDALSRCRDAVAQAELGMDAGRPVGAAAAGVDLFDQRQQSLVITATSTGAARLPGIKARGRHLHGAAQSHDRVVGLLRLDEAEDR